MKTQLFLVLASLLFVNSCAQKDADKIGDAQACLDKAKTASQANTCIAKVEGINSASADGIRCAGKFIGEGFSDPQKYLTALNNLSGGGGVSGLMGALSFTSQSDITLDTDNAEVTFGYCSNSGGKGATLLAVFAYLNNAIYDFVSNSGTVAHASCAATPTASGYDFSGCITASPGDAGIRMVELLNASTANAGAQSVQTALGAAILTTYNTSCSSGSITSEMCTTLSSAVTGNTANPRAIFTSFLNGL